LAEYFIISKNKKLAIANELFKELLNERFLEKLSEADKSVNAYMVQPPKTNRQALVTLTPSIDEFNQTFFEGNIYVQNVFKNFKKFEAFFLKK